MIFVVDDDEAIREVVKKILGEAGYEVRTFSDARVALEQLESEDPELILSDVLMPSMSGYDFRRAYQQSHPNRGTPFVFLSSLSDPEHMVAGLDLGADDYLAKPIHPGLLRAKVRTLSRQNERFLPRTFAGDLSKFPFAKILQFCELKGLTGTVRFKAGPLELSLGFRRGEPVLGDGDDYTALDQLTDLEEGSFVIEVAPMNFREIEYASLLPDRTAEVAGPERPPMGTLSGVRAGDRLFQIQTEYVSSPERQVVTIVTLDGKTVLKRISRPDDPGAPDAWPRLIREQHASVETEVHERLVQLGRNKKETTEPSPREQFSRLFEEGLDLYLAGQYPAALEVWRRASELDPNNKALEVNMRLLERKMQSQAR